MGCDTLTITDNRTGKSYVIPVHYGTYPAAGAAIWATDLRQIRVSEDDFGLMSYDPGFMNTAAARSRVTFVDGERGILRYRGYPIEQLAEQSTYLETAYLLLYGELPLREQLKEWTEEIIHHTMLHESIKKFLDGFHYDAHPMGMLIGALGALSTFYPEARHIHDLVVRRKQTVRLIAKMPTLAAFAYRHSRGLPYAYPDNALSYTGNFLNMLFKTTELRYTPHPVLERALNVLFVLHADHEQNCSTSAIRGIGTPHAAPSSALAGAAAALYGPLHGGASGEVLRMLGEIGAPNRVPGYVARVKTGEFKLMGFGHRVYKNYDPRDRAPGPGGGQGGIGKGKEPRRSRDAEREKSGRRPDRHRPGLRGRAGGGGGRVPSQHGHPHNGSPHRRRLAPPGGPGRRSSGGVGARPGGPPRGRPAARQTHRRPPRSR